MLEKRTNLIRFAFLSKLFTLIDLDREHLNSSRSKMIFGKQKQLDSQLTIFY